MSVSDLMSGLMLVFLCIAVLFMFESQAFLKQVEEAKDQIERDKAQYENLAKEYRETRSKLQDALNEEFVDAEKLGAEIVPGELRIRFLDREAGYADMQDTVPLRFRTKLAEFTPRLVRLLYQEDYRDHVVELRIEGHTSSHWATGLHERLAYLENMRLSQRRAFYVLDYLLSLPEIANDEDRDLWLRDKLRATGLSSSRTLPRGGEEDPVQSRRVEFRIVTDTDRRMEALLRLERGER